jgi:hypothetical protein
MDTYLHSFATKPYILPLDERSKKVKACSDSTELIRFEHVDGVS